jgi:hypothetical protein
MIGPSVRQFPRPVAVLLALALLTNPAAIANNCHYVDGGSEQTGNCVHNWNTSMCETATGVVFCTSFHRQCVWEGEDSMTIYNETGFECI